MSTTIDPADFSTVIDNPYFPLKPGTTFIYESLDGSEVTTFKVTRDTIKIEVAPGVFVECVVVRDTVTEDGLVVEITMDFFAQKEDGSVWYFGENVTNFHYDEKGKLIGTDSEGEWRAGVDGAEPGIIMLANPQPGDEYNQENAPGVAEDHAEVISVNGSVGNVPYVGGSLGSLLEIRETTPLDPTALEHKFYASGIGAVAAIDPETGEAVEQLVKIRFDGTGAADMISGNIGTDELLGYAGNDTIDGLGGDDTLRGMLGNDTLNGGAGDDIMNGGLGNDSFVFAAGFGDDRIRGFDARPAGGQDILDISAFGITAATFDDEVEIADVDDDTLVTLLDSGDTIRLVGIKNSAAVTIDDFLLDSAIV